MINIDTTLHRTINTTQIYNVNGQDIPVNKWQIYCDITERDFLPIFDIPAPLTRAGTRVRRIILPMFEYDTAAGFVVGEEVPTTLDARMEQVIQTVQLNGMDEFGPQRLRDIPGVEQYLHAHLIFAEHVERHLMGCVPFLDQMPWCFMTRSTIQNRYPQAGQNPTV